MRELSDRHRAKGLVVAVFLIAAPSNGEGLCEHEGTMCVCCQGATNMCEAFNTPGRLCCWVTHLVPVTLFAESVCESMRSSQRATSEVRPHIPSLLFETAFVFVSLLCFVLLLLLFDLRGPGWLTLSFQEPPVSGSPSCCRNNGVTDTQPCAVFCEF